VTDEFNRINKNIRQGPGVTLNNFKVKNKT